MGRLADVWHAESYVRDLMDEEKRKRKTCRGSLFSCKHDEIEEEKKRYFHGGRAP